MRFGAQGGFGANLIFLTESELVELKHSVQNAAEGESRLLLPKSGLHLQTGFQNRQ
jgi:hypothetical protein